ncbi:hypothetical protein BASA83_008486 [Batrachochytrium salamandrivorans]|nr:hypothetical protein BASA83_008486 [Batrachochytrium salamandrivorans]
MTQQDENSILALHMNTSVYPQLRILESLAQWIRELGATHPFTPPLENLLKEANAHQYSYSSIPSPPILPSSSLTNAHMSSTHHPVSKLKKICSGLSKCGGGDFSMCFSIEEVEIHRGDSQSIYAGQNARMVFDLLEMWFEMHPAVVSQKVCQAQLLYPKPLQLIVENIATLFYPDKLYIETHIHAILCRVECDLQTNPIPHIQFLTSLFGNDATLPAKDWIYPPCSSIIDLWRCISSVGGARIFGELDQTCLPSQRFLDCVLSETAFDVQLLCGTLLDCLWICLAGMETPRESCEPISYSSEEEKSRSIVGGIPLYHLPEIYREVCDFEADLCMLLEWIKTLIVRFPESILLIVDAWRQKLCQTSKILDKVDAVVAGLLQCLTSLHSSDFLFSDLDINCLTDHVFYWYLVFYLPQHIPDSGGFGCVLSSHEFLLSLNRILAKMESELEVRENVMVLPEDSVTSFWVELDLPKVLGFTIGLFYAALCCASELTDVEKVVMFKRYISDPILPDVGNVVFHALGTLSYHSLGIRALLSTPTAVLVLSILQTKTQAAANIQRNALLLLQNMYEHARSDLPKVKDALQQLTISHHVIPIIIQHGLGLSSIIPNDDIVYCIESGLHVLNDALSLTPRLMMDAIRIPAGSGPHAGLASCLSDLLTYPKTIEYVNHCKRSFNATPTNKGLPYTEKAADLEQCHSSKTQQDLDLLDYNEVVGNMIERIWSLVRMSLTYPDFLSDLLHCRLIESLVAHLLSISFGSHYSTAALIPGLPLVSEKLFFLKEILALLQCLSNTQHTRMTSNHATQLIHKYKRNGVMRHIGRYVDLCVQVAQYSGHLHTDSHSQQNQSHPHMHTLQRCAASIQEILKKWK